MPNVKLLKKILSKDKTVYKSSTVIDLFNRYDRVKYSTSLSDFNGVGEEIWMDETWTYSRAIFLDGHIKRVEKTKPDNSLEDTLESA